MHSTLPDPRRIITTQVDFMYEDEEPHAELADALEPWATTGLHAEVIDPHGPGGGAAVVQLTGPAHAVEQALRKVWDTDDQDLWSLYGIPTHRNFVHTSRVTTEKLEGMLNAFRTDGWPNVTAQFVGGRDWLIIGQR